MLAKRALFVSGNESELCPQFTLSANHGDFEMRSATFLIIDSIQSAVVCSFFSFSLR